MSSIRIFRGEFGHVSVLSAASDLVTHAHPEAHIIIWLCGNPGKMIVGDTQVDIGPGIAVGVNSFQPHSHSFDRDGAPGSFLAFYIEPQWMANRELPRRAERMFANPAILLDQRLKSLIAALLDRTLGLNEAGHLAGFETERLICELIEEFEAAQTSQMAVPMPLRRIDYRVRRAVEMMRSDVSGRMGLDEVARSVGLSRPHFYALFKEQMGVTPNVFWNALRMKEALRQIEDSEESFTSVACNLGFTSQGNFTRFFRDHAGVPPTLYREAARTFA